MDWLLIALVIIVGAGGALFAFRWNSSRRGSTNRVNQTNIRTSGDVAGRDVNKHK